MDNALSSEIAAEVADALRVEGIDKKGYGVLVKFVMEDVNLSFKAKVLYAYLCSYSGGNNEAFPSVERIKSELGLGKKLFNISLKELLDAGYLTKTQAKQERARFAHNIYTIILDPTRFQEAVKSKPEKYGPRESTVTLTGMKTYGYGLIPRLVMIDPRLSASSKGIYAYFVALAGSTLSLNRSVEQICRELTMNRSTYFKHLKPLIEYNYIIAKQIHNQQLGSNVFTLVQKPDEEEQQTNRKEKIVVTEADKQNSQSAKKGTTVDASNSRRRKNDQSAKKESTVKETTVKAAAEEEATVKEITVDETAVNETAANVTTEKEPSINNSVPINSRINNSLFINSLSINREPGRKPPLFEIVESSNLHRDGLTDSAFRKDMSFLGREVISVSIEEIDNLKRRELASFIFEYLGISHESFLNELPIDFDDVQKLGEILVDILMDKRKEFTVGELKIERVDLIRRYLQLDYESISGIAFRLHQVTRPIRNIKFYCLSAFYNAGVQKALLEEQYNEL